jgi:hypothetical protein
MIFILENVGEGEKHIFFIRRSESEAITICRWGENISFSFDNDLWISYNLFCSNFYSTYVIILFIDVTIPFLSNNNYIVVWHATIFSLV